jgi:acyl-[acyl-carrier-protein]-phospholipid O-acyltransferase / long-chain-fatty-acid--[acyl-carrier-protein] ligase
LLRSKGFMAFLVTQFLGAFNDNLYKMVVQLLVLSRGFTAHTEHALLSLASIIFILPGFFFSGYAGYFADTYSKQRVLQITKSLEIVAVVLAFLALNMNNAFFVFVVLFLLSTHSAFFSPAKYSILPEMLPQRELSRANGLLELTTFVAIIFGTALGGVLMSTWRAQQSRISFVLIALAVIGTLTSIGIPRVLPSGANKKFKWDPFTEIYGGLKKLRQHRVLLVTILAISYFFGVGLAAQLNILLFTRDILHVTELGTGLLTALLGLGIGVGSIAAGALSGDEIEYGLVPVGALGISGFTILLGVAAWSIPMAAVWFFFLGFFCGLFVVPLNAILQTEPEAQEKGQLLATNNCLNAVAMLLASGIMWALLSFFHLGPQLIFIVIGITTCVGLSMALMAVPLFFKRFLVWLRVLPGSA